MDSKVGKIVALVFNNPYQLSVDCLWTVFIACLGRVGCYEAILYKRSKKEIKNFYGKIPFIKHLFACYSPKSTHAPNHMYVFQGIRIIAWVLLLFSIVCELQFSLEQVCHVVFLGKMYLLFIPFMLYCVFAPHRGRRFDFSRFNKP